MRSFIRLQAVLSRSNIRRRTAWLASALTILFVTHPALADCTSPPASLVGWWRAEGNANDTTGGNNGSLVGGTITAGRVGQAFDFNGTGQKVTLPDNDALKLTNSLTIEGWVFARANGFILFRGDNRPGFDAYALSIELTHELQFLVCDDGGRVVALRTPGPVALNEWLHVAATLDGDTGQIRLYVNGVLAAQAVTTLRPARDLNPANDPGVGIGGHAGSYNFFPFDGKIDELSLYNRALTAAEIAAIHAADAAGKCVGSQPPGPSPAGAIAWWKAEDSARDQLGAHDGTTPFGIAYAEGMVGRAFDFDGSTRRVSVPDSPAFKMTNGLTLEGWVYPREYTGFICFRGDNRGGLDTWVLDAYQAGYANFQIDDAANNYASVRAPLQLNQWQHIAATWDRSSGDLKLYADGVLRAQTNTTVIPIADLDASGAVGIGNHGGTFHQFPFNGLIDELTIYSRALSTAEIAAIHAAGSAGKSPVEPPLVPPPSITEFAPKKGTNGTIMTLTGTNFSPVAASNIVYFGAVRATVTAASSTSITVTVPKGASYAAPTVTVNGLVGTANTAFTPTFPGGGLLSASSFSPRANLTPGDGPNQTVIADLDGDGKPDLVVADDYGHTLSLYRSISIPGSLTAASFEPRVILPGSAADYSPYMLVAADVDGDGKLDLVATDLGGNTVSVFRNQSVSGSLTSSSFAPRVSFAVGGSPRGLAVADLDADGKPEIVTANYNDNTVSVLRNTGAAGQMTTSSFAAHFVLPAGGGTYGLAVADLDGDGKRDIATANNAAGTVSLLRNLGTGPLSQASFAAQVTIAAPAYAHFLRASDIDGDGKPDLLLTSYLGQTVSVYRNTAVPGVLGGSSFATPVAFTMAGRGHTLSLGDLNGDGKPDMAVDTEIGDSIAIFQNLSTPGGFTSASFASRVDLAAGYNTWGCSIGDLDGDGRPDIVFANANDDTVSLYRNLSSTEPVTPPPAILTFTPQSGFAGIPVTITGTNFSPVAASNIVYFGAVRATVTAASATSLTVMAPPGATYAPPSVTVAGLTGSALKPFVPTFDNLGAGFGTNSFAPKFDLPAGSIQIAVAIGDLDGDGRPDVVAANVYTATVSIYRNISAAGTLAAASFAPRVDLATGTYPYSCALADVDGDGKLDVIVGNNGNGGGNTVSVFRNLSTPGSLTTSSFAARVNFTVATGPTRIAAGDLDGDGKQDLAVITSQGGGVSVLRNTATVGSIGTGSFAPFVQLPTGPNSWDVKIGDLDGDGKRDLVAASYSNGTISLLRNLSTPGSLATNSFAPKVDLSIGTTYNADIGDLDGDGKPDLVVTKFNSSSVAILRNLSTPGSLTANSFAAPVSIATGASPRDVTLGDVNGDSKPDIVVCAYGAARISILRNTATPGTLNTNSFAPKVDIVSGVNPAMAAMGDLDGDGRPDLIASSFGSSAVTVLQNMMVAQPPVVTLQPASQTVVLGDRVVFAVGAAGTPPLAYQWRFNSDPIAASTNSTLVLPDVQLTQAGSYSVTVSNSAGSATSSNASLTVLVPSCTTAPAGLVGWWPLEETGADHAGTNAGSLFGAPTFAAGKVGLAMTFDAVNDSVRIPASPSLNVGAGSGLTIEAWIKPASVASQQPLVEWNSGAGTMGTHFWISVASQNGGPGSLWANFMDAGGVAHQISSATGLLTTNAYQHVAVVYDKSSGATELYLNGSMIAQTNLGSFTPDTRWDAYLGLRPSGVAAGTRYRGNMDEVSIYNRALGTNEIAAIYAARGMGKCPLPPMVLNVTPPSWHVNEGATVAFTATAVGSPVLTYQWQHNGADLAGATGSTLTLSNIVYAQGGNYAVVVSNPGGTATSSNVLLRVNRAPIASVGDTELLLVSPNGSNAVAILDGSASSDPDGDLLSYAWFHTGGTNAFATGAVAVETLPLGTNQLTLVVSDGMASGSRTFAVEVISPSQAVTRLMTLVQSAPGNTQSLLASLRVAQATIDRGQPATAINQLEALKNKVLAQIARTNPALATQLLAALQVIIDALNGGAPAPAVALEITSLSPGNNGKPHLKIKGLADRVHIVESSADTVNWVKVGIARGAGGNQYEFDDAQAPSEGARFYRIVSPK